MRNLIKADQRTCRKCKYHMGFGSQPGGTREVDNNVACNYLAIKGHSRIFENGKEAYDPEYCDKYIPGRNTRTGWTSDSMTTWSKEDELRRKFWKELEP